jgi:hypothetical protein
LAIRSHWQFCGVRLTEKCADLNHPVGQLWLDTMTIEIGQVKATFRYPVKSMAGLAGERSAAQLPCSLT